MSRSPVRLARKKSVVFVVPTTWPEGPSQTAAAMLASVSTTLQCTPPCNNPYGCSRPSETVQEAVSSSRDADVTVSPMAFANGPRSCRSARAGADFSGVDTRSL